MEKLFKVSLKDWANGFNILHTGIQSEVFPVELLDLIRCAKPHLRGWAKIVSLNENEMEVRIKLTPKKTDKSVEKLLDEGLIEINPIIDIVEREGKIITKSKLVSISICMKKS